MKILCAPDSYKESLSALQVAKAMEKGIKRADARSKINCCPIADGGEGSVDALLSATGGEARYSTVTGPLGNKIKAKWGVLDTAKNKKVAVIEMASACGLELVPKDKRDPGSTTTYGCGELISAALDEGAKKIILAIGGSATNDGGCGAAQALGAKFYDGDDKLIEECMRGELLKKITRIDLTNLHGGLVKCEILVACDVTNPLTGSNGAAYIYGPQKGANKKEVKQLDDGLKHLADIVKNDLKKDIQNIVGAGAAGGFGFGAVAFLDAKLKRGVDLILSAIDFEKKISDCDLCLTGEGKLDSQSLSGKTISGVAKAGKKYGVPVIALVGKFEGATENLSEYGLEDVIEIGADLPVQESINRSEELLEEAAYNVVIQRKDK